MQNVADTCPHCGNDVFIWHRGVNEIILSHADRTPISILESETVEPASTTPICHNCQNPVPVFVTEEFFHTVICDEAYEDTIPFFVEGELLRKYIRRIGQKANVVLEKTESIAATSPSYPFLLKISLVRNEQDLMEVTAKILTHEPATSEHVRTVELDTKVTCPPAVAGRYAFEYEGKMYSFYIMEKPENDLPVVPLPTTSPAPLTVFEEESMTPVTYIVLLDASFVRDTQYYTGNPADLEGDVEHQDEDAWFDATGEIVLTYVQAHSATQAKAIAAEKNNVPFTALTAFPKLPDFRIEDLTKGNDECNGEPAWTLIFRIPGEELPFVLRSEDDRAIGMAMQMYMRSGATKEMFTLLPPTTAFNIDEFLGRFPQ